MKGRLIFLSLTALFVGCGSPTKKKDVAPPSVDSIESGRVNRPDFNADTAYTFISNQIAFGPRVPNTVSHRNCGIYLFEILRRYCDTVYVQETSLRAWDGSLLKVRNFIGSFRPEDKSRHFVAAHWDSRPYGDQDPDSSFHRQAIDGANDGASGVGVILEMARVLSENAPPRGVDLILFDAEDYGEPSGEETGSYEYWAMGSAYWARNPHQQNYRAHFGILLDMVGVKNARFTMEGTSMYFAPDIMRRIWDKAAEAGYSSYFLREETSALIDDHLPINEILGIPTIDIIHREGEKGASFFPHWHTHNDNLENVDIASIGVVGTLMLDIVYTGL